MQNPTYQDTVAAADTPAQCTVYRVGASMRNRAHGKKRPACLVPFDNPRGLARGRGRERQREKVWGWGGGRGATPPLPTGGAKCCWQQGRTCTKRTTLLSSPTHPPFFVVLGVISYVYRRRSIAVGGQTPYLTKKENTFIYRS